MTVQLNPSEVIKVGEELLDMGCYEISLGDTLGSATPETTQNYCLRFVMHLDKDLACFISMTQRQSY